MNPRRVAGRAALAALAILVIGCGKGSRGPVVDSGLPVGATRTPETSIPAQVVGSAPPAPLSVPMMPMSFAPIARAANPSVVTINTVGEETEKSAWSGRLRKRQTSGLGTGFIIDADGTIVTNNHVVQDATTVAVKLSDGQEFPARIVGRDPPTDMAVVKIEAKGLAALSLGDSDRIDVGDWVVAIGNPFGLEHTVSAGIVSAKGRTKEDVPLDPSGYYNFLQTDASINPGNSGGPLLNLRGEVVGINSAIRGGGAQGIGFAIPINMVKQLLPMLLRDGHITRSALGVRIRDARELSVEEKTALKLADDKGAVIEYVAPGGAADKSGLAAGDVIVSFDGQPIERGTLLQWLASTTGVGRTVTVGIARSGKRFDQKVTLGQLPTAPPRE